jgi:2-keto-4-pentenoate hydratase/2-oxohepta-3-ene-1,7-dioic acid hydratase in catechol pathway
MWSPEIVPHPQKLKYKTVVGGEVLQETGTSDMIWSVKQLIAHLSKGTTVRRGTVIMTGTPSGVGFFRKRFLKDGDIVFVEVEGLGGIANKMVLRDRSYLKFCNS